MASLRARRLVFAACGLICLGMAILGWILPVIPGTPFFLLAAWLLYRSSPRLHRWLTQNRLFGRYVHDYQQGHGIPRIVKVGLILWIWVPALLSALFVARATWLRMLLLAIATGMTWNILRIPTRHR